MSEMIPTEMYVNDYIPMELWGRDHWSMLAYLETRDVDHGGLKVAFDARMRQNRVHFRILLKCNHSELGLSMDPNHGSRLNNGQYALGHDDWNCVQDFANAKLLTMGCSKKAISADSIEPQKIVHLSQLGQYYASKLRAHKASGGNFSNFKI